MRETFLQKRRWRIAAAAVGLGIVAIAAGGAVFLGTQSSAQPPPQAAASAPLPTLIAVEATAETTSPEATPEATPESSPFAGIAAPPPQPPERTGLVHHSVAEGEVLWHIAEQYNLRPETILWANDLQDPDLLLVGQDLVIPPSDGVLYTVRPGDRLVDIADRYGLDAGTLVTANHLDNADQIQAGVDIFLPGGRPLTATASSSSTADTAESPDSGDDQAAATSSEALVLPDNIDAMLGAGWLAALHPTNLYKSADGSSSVLDQLPPGAPLERVSGVKAGRIQVRDPGDGRTRQAMTGWVNAIDLNTGRSPATRQLPLAYPSDTAMDIFHVFAPYRSQLDGSAYAEANCGPTALGMALDAFGINVSPRQLRSEALDAQHMYGNGTGTLITALATVASEHGLQALDLRSPDGSIRHWGLDDIRAHIQAGHPVIVQVRYRSLPGRGGAYFFGDHYILVTGIVGDGFLYNDPIDVDGIGWDRVISGASLQVAMNASDSRYAYSAVAIAR
jgi:LysM repeat protein